MLDRPRKPFRPGHYQTPKPPRDPERPKHAERDRYDWITLWTAIIGVFFVVVGTGVSAYQAIVMRRELASAVRQQRAWLRVDIEPDGDVTIDQAGARVPLKIRLTNVDSLPAVGVWTGVSLRAFAALPIAFDELPDVERGAMCDSKVFPGTGLAVFPGETVALTEVGMLSRKDINAFDGKREMALAISACALYGDGASASDRHTDRIVTLGRKWTVEDRRLGFDRLSDRIKPADLVIQTPPNGGVAD